MKRRQALKHIGLSTGFVVATPTLISLLQSCTAEADAWQPRFLTVDQGKMVTALVDVFLPRTDLPSAGDLNIAQFIDGYYQEIVMAEEQVRLKAGLAELMTFIGDTYDKNIDKLTEDQYKDLLDNYMVNDQPRTPADQPMTVSDVLHNLKWRTVAAYKVSEEIGENVLAYDPVPAAYYCGDLEELTGGKAYSLS